jgi:hypothetical protein
MSNWDRFVETFFNAKVMAKYLPTSPTACWSRSSLPRW